LTICRLSSLGFVVDGIEEYYGSTIISARSEEMRLNDSREKCGRGLPFIRTWSSGKSGVHNEY